MPTVGNKEFPYTKEGKRKAIDSLKDIEDKIKPLIDRFELKSRTFREKRIRVWKLLDNYWNDLQYSYWDSESGVWTGVQGVVIPGENRDLDESPRQANIYKAHGESIIAALSSGVPSAQFYPEQADDADDISTAKAYSIIADIIKSHNNFSTLFVKLLFTLWNQDFAAIWNYTDEDVKFGTYSKTTFRDVETEEEKYSCPECAEELETGPDIAYCPECEENVTPDVIKDTKTESVPQIEHINRSRVMLRVFGPRDVEIPAYVETQGDTPYLTLRRDLPAAKMREAFKEFYDEIKESEGNEYLEDYVRQQYDDFEQDKDTTEVKLIWVRPWAFNYLDDKEMADECKEMFPTGARFTFISNHLVEAKEEVLDEHWTITKSPMANHLHTNPIGHSLVDIADMTNDLLNITDQTIHQGVSEVFVDPDVVDFDLYGQRAAAPGQMTQAKPVGGRSLSDAFFSTRPATLSNEVGQFGDALKEMGQFVSGALPSIFGGASTGGSDTAAEYSMSRQNALQRLSVHYKMLTEFIVEVLHKSVRLYTKTMMERESLVETRGGNNFVNVWVTKEETKGRIGRVIAAGSDELPSSWLQKKDLLMNLMERQNPAIDAALYHPQNTTLLKTALGLDELYIPGEDSRNKQWSEIESLLEEQPQGENASSIPITQDVDDDAVEFAVIQTWLNSPQGQETRKSNPQGYLNVLLHGKEHKESLARLTEGQSGASPEGEPPESEGE